MGIPIYKIRGHHFLELSHFLYDDELSKKLDWTFNSRIYGEEFMNLEKRIWTDFVEGRCRIKLIDTYDALCLETGCFERQESDEFSRKFYCMGGRGKEDREIIRTAGLELGKEYGYLEIGIVHKPEWYQIERALSSGRSLFGDRLEKKDLQELAKIKAQIEEEEKG